MPPLNPCPIRFCAASFLTAALLGLTLNASANGNAPQVAPGSLDPRVAELAERIASARVEGATALELDWPPLGPERPLSAGDLAGSHLFGVESRTFQVGGSLATYLRNHRTKPASVWLLHGDRRGVTSARDVLAENEVAFPIRLAPGEARLLAHAGPDRDLPPWVSLFNGKDLSGWNIHGEEDWHVEDGVIVSQSTKGGYGYLATEKTYRDFALRAEFRCEAEGNSGLFFHSTLDGTNIRGVQGEVDPKGRTAGLYESGGRGWIAQPDPSLHQRFRQDDWNRMDIICIGSHTITRLNGYDGVDLVDPEARYEDGVIALQLHSGGGVRVLWKNLAIRDLSGWQSSD